MVLEDALAALSLYGHEAVLWTLIASSGLTITIALERAYYQSSQRTSLARLRHLEPEAVPLSPAGLVELEAADGFEGRVVSVGLKAGAIAGSSGAEEAMAAALSREQGGLERGLSVIGSVGANAPFVGLLGTVLGIVRAFQDLALDTSEGTTAVMTGISEALVATAIGLLVAIPAVILYNWLAGRNERIMRRLEQLSRVVLLQLAADEASAVQQRRGA